MAADNDSLVPHGNVINFQARATMILNGRKQELEGRGVINSRDGVVHGKYHHNIAPGDFDPLIFQTVLVTGYPSVCKQDFDFVNPFQQGDYRYHRQIDFGPHGDMDYDVTCWTTDGPGGLTLNSTFNVRGNVRVRQLQGALPLVERWIPNGEEIAAAFDMVWPAADGPDRIVGKAITQYHPSPSARILERPAHRRIEFSRARSQGQALEIVQQSWIHGPRSHER